MQELVFGVKMHPLAGSHVSSVHPLPSLHHMPGMQLPPEQVSPTVHGSPSSHAPERGVWVQPAAPSRESAVHGFPSSQEYGRQLGLKPSVSGTPLVKLPSTMFTVLTPPEQ